MPTLFRSGLMDDAMEAKHWFTLTPRRISWIFAVWLSLLWIPASSRADGKVFRPAASLAEVSIPDQQALLTWSNGVERLIIQTRFEGQGKDFAWVVPLPSAPSIEVSTPGLFPTLRFFTSPKIIHNAPKLFQIAIILSSIAWLLLTLKPDEDFQPGDLIACLAFGISLESVTEVEIMAVLGFFILFAACMAVRLGKRPAYVVILALVLGFLLLGLLLPALASASPTTLQSEESNLEILGHQKAGIYESTTIGGKDPMAIQSWLSTNGFHIPSNTVPVIADYVKDNWVFVASKVRPEGATNSFKALPPISFTFNATNPVYPLRLTGTDARVLDVDLYVFGPARARANGFVTRICQPTSVPPPPEKHESLWRPRTDQHTFPLGHEELQRAILDGTRFTKLQARLTPNQMKQDAWIEWQGMESHEDVRYSKSGAFWTAINHSVTALCLMIVSFALVARIKNLPLSFSFKILKPATALLLIYSTILFFTLEKIEGKIARVSRWTPFTFSNEVKHFILAALDEKGRTNTMSVLSMETTIHEAFKDWAKERGTKANFWSPKLEDSPLNFSVRQGPHGAELLHYDGVGRARPVALE